MFKNIKTIKGAKSLSKQEQKSILGGFFGHGECAQQIFQQCFDDSDCPCNRSCGVTVDGGPQGPITFDDLCQFI